MVTFLGYKWKDKGIAKRNSSNTRFELHFFSEYNIFKIGYEGECQLKGNSKIHRVPIFWEYLIDFNLTGRSNMIWVPVCFQRQM